MHFLRRIHKIKIEFCWRFIMFDDFCTNAIEFNRLLEFQTQKISILQKRISKSDHEISEYKADVNNRIDRLKDECTHQRQRLLDQQTYIDRLTYFILWLKREDNENTKEIILNEACKYAKSIDRTKRII